MTPLWFGRAYNFVQPCIPPTAKEADLTTTTPPTAANLSAQPSLFHRRNCCTSPTASNKELVMTIKILTASGWALTYLQTLFSGRHRHIPFVICITFTHSFHVFTPVSVMFLNNPLLHIPIPTSPLPLLSLRYPYISSFSSTPSFPPVPPMHHNQGSRSPRSGRSGICILTRGDLSTFRSGGTYYNFPSFLYPYIPSPESGVYPLPPPLTTNHALYKASVSPISIMP